jgi:hypothetical protein
MMIVPILAAQSFVNNNHQKVAIDRRLIEKKETYDTPRPYRRRRQLLFRKWRKLATKMRKNGIGYTEK